MFKSIFIKYISMFMCIIILCITLLASIITSIINSYGTDQRLGALSFACSSLSEFIKNDYDSKSPRNFSEYLYSSEESIHPVMNLLSGNIGNMLVFITDAEGNVSESGGSSGIVLETEVKFNSDGKYTVPSDIMLSIYEQSELTFTNDMNGFFVTENIVSARAIFSGSNEFLGSVFVCSTDNGVDSLMETMTKTIIISGLLIMAAALIATYFISERLVAPIKEMRYAAKAFSDGHFDVRINAVGSDEVAELAEAFNSMAQSLAELEDMRRNFLANVSHELRTPMTTIVGFIDSILDGAIPPEKHDYYLEIISDEVKRLSRLVTSLLDISRMQAGEKKFNMKSFDVCETARQVLISFEQRIDEKKLNVFFDCDSDNMNVYADPDAIHQVIYNLCENGIKFANEGGRYGISVRKSGAKQVEISIFDEGMGIKENELKYVFDRFYKTDKSRGLDKTGVGLGLYIVRTIIEAHGETIRAESEYGKWCRFVFTLPTENTDKRK